jgi:hypothetical protein
MQPKVSWVWEFDLRIVGFKLYDVEDAFLYLRIRGTNAVRIQWQLESVRLR